MTKIWLVESNDYEGSYVLGVWDNEAAAANHAAALNENGYGDNRYSFDEHEVRSVSTHRVEHWFEAIASWDKISGYKLHSYERRQIFQQGEALDLTDGKVERFRSQHYNPGYVRGTPNARIPDTPGGRYITTPAWVVTIRDRDEATAKLRALTLLNAALEFDGVKASEQV